jgi:hypothetical protein
MSELRPGEIRDFPLFVARIDRGQQPTTWLCDGFRQTSLAAFATSWWDPWKLWEHVERYRAPADEGAAMTIPNATFTEWLQSYALPRGFCANFTQGMLLDDKEFMDRRYTHRKDIEDYVAREYPDHPEMQDGIKQLGVNFIRWRHYNPKTWRTCPKCRSRATKMFSLNSDNPFQCQACMHEYKAP